MNVNWPQARGAPSTSANENLPDIGYPGSLPAMKLRIIRQMAGFATPKTRLIALALREEVSHGRLMLLAPICLGVGAVTWFVVPFNPSPQPLLGLLALAGAALALNRYRRPALAALSAVLMLALAGALLAALETWRNDTILLDKPVTTDMTAIVETREASGDGRYHYEVTLLSTRNPALKRMPQTVSLLVRGANPPADIGDRIEGRVRLTPPSGPALPGLHDFGFAAYFSGVGANGFFYGAPKVFAAQPGSTIFSRHAWLRRLHALRTAVGDRIRNTIAGDPGAFAAALITNEQRAISPRTIEVLRLSGLAHIIAISGMNMALAAGVFFVDLRSLLSLSVGFVQRFPVKKLAALGALIATTAYYMISGFAVSAERAYLMMMIMLVAVLFDRPALSLRNIALSAILILVLSPSALLGASLQMSYAGTLGLVSGYEYWASRTPRQRMKPAFPMPQAIQAVFRFVSGAFATSLIGGTSTALFAAEHFQRISTYGLAANVLAEPLIALLVMPAGFIAMLLMPLGLDTLPLMAMGYGLKGVIAIGSFVAGWGGQWQTGSLPAWFMPLASAGFLLLTLLKTRLRLAGLAVMALALGSLFLKTPQQIPDLVIAEDGQLAAFATKTALAPNRRHPPAFLFDQWKRALNLEETIAPSLAAAPSDVRRDSRDDRYRPLTDDEEASERVFLQGTADESKEGRFVCKANAWCLGRTTRGGIIAVVENSIYTGLACDVADIVVASPSPRFDHCQSGALLVTRETLRRTGALALWFGSDPRKPRLQAAKLDDGRPWAAFRQYDWRSDTRQPDIPLAVRGLIGEAPVPQSAGADRRPVFGGRHAPPVYRSVMDDEAGQSIPPPRQ